MGTPEYDAFLATCTERLNEVQGRGIPPSLPVSADELRDRVRTVLQKASRAELLKTGAYNISRLLTPVCRSGRNGDCDTYVFSCGPTKDEDKDPASDQCLVRNDDAVISFSITLKTNRECSRLELVAYRYDITFLPVTVPASSVLISMGQTKDTRPRGFALTFIPAFLKAACRVPFCIRSRRFIFYWCICEISS